MSRSSASAARKTAAVIRDFQQRLADRGFDPGPVDGIYGAKTAAAVARARQQFGLPPGNLDGALLRALRPPVPVAGDLLRTIAQSIISSQLKGLIPMTFLSGYKTYIIAGLMLLAGLAGVLGIDIPSFTGQAPGDLVMEALAFFFLRQGLKTDASKS